MNELEQLLVANELTDEQRSEIRAYFRGVDTFAEIRPVAIEPTIRQSIVLHEPTVLVTEDDSGETSTEPNPNRVDGPRIGRYFDLGLLGKGGMGEVRRVRDPDLNRRLAMKIIHEEFLQVDSSLARFVEEAQVVAQLQHPNIVPIHELGRLDDGRLYFTMKEVQGRPLSELISAVHAASTDFAWMPTEDGWTFRRLMQVFSRVCAATAFAHSRGVVHRDLKPENILIGQFDEVLVVDWGIAKIIEHLRLVGSTDEHAVRSLRPSVHMTRMGEVAGTPAYMAPEQARGQIDRIDARSDIYALGAILYEILSGRCPYGGTSSEQVLSKVILGPPPSVRTTILSTARTTGTIELDFFEALEEEAIDDSIDGLDTHTEQGARLPEELVTACEKSMQRRPEARYHHADELRQIVTDWIDGAKKRDRAMDIVHRSQEIAEQAEALYTQIETLRETSEVARADLPLWADVSRLREAWSLEDRANRFEREAKLLSTRREQLLRGALTHLPELEEAHAELLREYRERHEKAELSGDEKRIAKARLSMEYHIARLDPEHPDRSSAEAYLAGTGLLSLATETPGAAVYCARYEVLNRRLQTTEEVLIGHTPLIAHPMEMGSYVLRLSREGCHDVIYPVSIPRQGHWSGRTPEGEQPPIWMPPSGTLAENECYVPAGPFSSGGDAGVPEGLDSAEIWVDSFVIERYPVTVAEYQSYLQALVDADRIEEFEAALPVRDAAASGSTKKSCFVMDSGRVQRVEDPTGVVPEPQWPIAFVNFRQAVDYASWRSETTGKRWRIPNEFEWEKAARGVDARVYPWGHHFTPSWCNMELSRESMSLVDVNSFPVDCSVYGVRGMGGNICQWTSSAWDPKLTIGGYQRVPPQTSVDVKDSLRTFKGGCWMFAEVFSHTSNRIGFHETDGVPHVGFRLGRDLD